MNLKESYRYANYLDNLLNAAYKYLATNGFITTVKQEHLRSKVNPEATDETIIVPKFYDVDFHPMDVINFVVKVFDEREKLVKAIADAKNSIELNIDNSISMNKKRQAFIEVLESMALIKSKETIVNGSGYKFNTDGNQVSYNYEVKQVTSIDFDRNDVKALIKKFNKQCDEVSSKLDSIEINTEVQFTPLWDVNDKLEDILAAE